MNEEDKVTAVFQGLDIIHLEGVQGKKSICQANIYKGFGVKGLSGLSGKGVIAQDLFRN